MGCSISYHRTCGSALWIWGYRCRISGHREASVLYIPRAVRNLFDFRVAGQRRFLSYNQVSRVATPARQRGREQGTRRREDWVACVLCSLRFFCAVRFKRTSVAAIRKVFFALDQSHRAQTARRQIPHLNPLPLLRERRTFSRRASQRHIERSRDISGHATTAAPQIARDSSTTLGMTKGCARGRMRPCAGATA